MINSGLFTSDKDYWETPKGLFDELNEEFSFDLDVAASHSNAKLPKYYTVEDDALKQKWAGSVFVNPPYGREIKHWVKKAYEESLLSHNKCVVMLIPSRTDTSYWHDYIFGKAKDIRFLRGRIKFELNGETKQSAPFPSAVVVFDNHKGKSDRVRTSI